MKLSVRPYSNSKQLPKSETDKISFKNSNSKQLKTVKLKSGKGFLFLTSSVSIVMTQVGVL